MRIAKEVPLLLPKQKCGDRYWNTADMLDVLSVYYGISQILYRGTWRYRALIAVHRHQYSVNMYGKGYGKDWKAEIKKDILEYTKNGRLPMVALKFESAQIREADLQMWRESYAQRRANQEGIFAQPQLVAAE